MNRRCRVLLVEDHDAYALTLATILSTSPAIEVVGHAADGRAGVALALAERPDVILMDIYMPELDGIAATAELTQRLPEAAVVVLSSSDLAEDVERARAAGARAYLLKDAGLEELLRTIAAAADAPAPDDEPAACAATPPRQPGRTATLRFCL